MDSGLMVDRIAVLDAQINELKTEREQLANELKRRVEKSLPVGGGSVRYAGSLHFAVITQQDRATVDWRAIAERLRPSRQLIAAYTTHSKVMVLKLVGINKAAA